MIFELCVQVCVIFYSLQIKVYSCSNTYWVPIIYALDTMPDKLQSLYTEGSQLWKAENILLSISCISTALLAAVYLLTHWLLKQVTRLEISLQLRKTEAHWEVTHRNGNCWDSYLCLYACKAHAFVLTPFSTRPCAIVCVYRNPVCKVSQKFR